MMPVGFAQPAAFVFDAAIAVVAVLFDDDLHHLEIVGGGVVAFGVEVVALGADGFGKGHQLIDAEVAVVHRVAIDAEIAEVGQRAAVLFIDQLHHAGQPLPVARQAAVVLDDHVQAVRRGELGESPQPVGGELLLLLEGQVGVRLRR